MPVMLQETARRREQEKLRVEQQQAADAGYAQRSRIEMAKQLQLKQATATHQSIEQANRHRLDTVNGQTNATVVGSCVEQAA